MKWLKRIGVLLLIILIGAGVFIGRFVYQAKVGFERYETAAHEVDIPSDRPAVLVISKTTGFRHSEAISASQSMFENLGQSNNWFIYSTEDAGIFNADQLNQFDVVVFNNATGTILDESQQSLFKKWLESGKGFVGIHAAGDGSHYRWPWYLDNIICAAFSHHPIKNQFQEATVQLINAPDSTWSLTDGWNHTDEWYIFKNQPSEKGASILYEINGNKIDPNGNILWVKGFENGMGEHHPIAWHKPIGQGRTFYTSMGHTAETFAEKEFVAMIEQAIKWTGKINE